MWKPIVDTDEETIERLSKENEALKAERDRLREMYDELQAATMNLVNHKEG